MAFPKSTIRLKCEECGGDVIFDSFTDMLVHRQSYSAVCRSKRSEHMNRPDLAPSVQKIKETVRSFPGLTLGLNRQVGKTQAILELMAEDRCGNAFYFCPTDQQAGYARARWENLHGHYTNSAFTSSLRDLRGSAITVYVDEWFSLSQVAQSELKEIARISPNRIRCRIGTDL